MNRVEEWLRSRNKIEFTAREVAEALRMSYSGAKLHIKKLRDENKVYICKWRKPKYGSMAHTMVFRLGAGEDLPRPEMVELRKDILAFVKGRGLVTSRIVADEFNIFTSAALYHLNILVADKKLSTVGYKTRPDGHGREQGYEAQAKAPPPQPPATTTTTTPTPTSAWNIAIKGLL